MEENRKAYVTPEARLRGFNRFVGLRFGEISDEYCEVFCDLKEHHLNPLGFAHGGMIATLTDVAAGTMALQIDRCEHNIVTQSCNIHYLRPGTGSLLRVRASVIRKGRRCCVVRTDCFNGEEKLCAAAIYEIAYLD